MSKITHSHHTDTGYAIILGMLLFSGPEDPRTRDRGDQGTREPRDPDPNWHTLYVYIHSTYIVHVSLIAQLECTTEQTKCTVDGTFVLAAFVPFHSEQTVSTELIKYACDL